MSLFFRDRKPDAIRAVDANAPASTLTGGFACSYPQTIRGVVPPGENGEKNNIEEPMCLFAEGCDYSNTIVALPAIALQVRKSAWYGSIILNGARKAPSRLGPISSRSLVAPTEDVNTK